MAISNIVDQKYGVNTSTPATGGLSAKVNLNPFNPNFMQPKKGLVSTPTTQSLALGGQTTPKTQATGATSGAGAYKGVQLSGTDAEIAEQMRKIDNPTPAVNSAITGNTTTPSGAVVNATTGATVTTPTAPTTPVSRGLFPDVLSSLQKIGNEGSQGYNKAVENLAGFDRTLAQKYGAIDNTPIPLNFQQGRKQVIQNQAATERTALSNAVSQQQTQQGQQISALQGVAGYASPRTADVLIDPTTGQPINGGDIGSEMARLASLRAKAGVAGTFTGDYETGIANLKAADSIGQQIKNTIASNPTINNQPLAAWTNIQQLLSGQFSDPAQQLLAQQVNQYIQTLGLDSNTVMNIASQQQGTLGQLLDSLRTSAAGIIESKNPQNIINQGSNSGTPSGGQIINTSAGPVDNAWF